MVSVILPSYNHGPFLQKRLESVFNQTHQDFEVIILDDCSTDNSVGILKRYATHPKVSHFIINVTNSGSPFKQWKKGIDLARGEYIWIAESDDWAEKSFLEKCLAGFKKYEDIGLVYCQSNIVDENNNILRSNAAWTDDISKSKWSVDYFNYGIEEIKSVLIYKNTIPNASAVLIKKPLLTEEFVFPSTMKMTGDWFCWVQLLSKSNVYYISEHLNNFRDTLQSTRIHDSVSKLFMRVSEEIQVLNYILEKEIINVPQYQERVYQVFNKRLSVKSHINLKFVSYFHLLPLTKSFKCKLYLFKQVIAALINRGNRIIMMVLKLLLKNNLKYL